MKVVESTILTITVPDEMVVVKPIESMVVLDYPKTNGTIDKPKIIISLVEIDNFSDYDGKDLLSKFRVSVAESRFKMQESGFETQTKNECPIHIVHAFTQATFQKIYYDFVYFDALIVINESYGIQFLVTFEKVDEAEFTKIYTDILDSLQWSGNTDDCAKYFEAINKRISEIENKYAETIAEIIQEWDRPINPFQIPSDGKDVFVIGDINFDIIQDQSIVEITSFSRELDVTLVAQTKAYKKGEKKLLLDINQYTEKSEKGLVKMTFPVLGIYQNGVPTGSFNIKDGKCETPYSLMRINGFEYTLDFYGNITFQNGWVGFNGYLKASYNEKPVFDVKIYKKFDTDSLDWRNYSFKSLEEALQAPKEVVQWLEIKNPTFEVLPESIFEFKNLKSLFIANSDWYSKLKLNYISDRIGELKQLESVHISRTNIDKIPECIGDLSNLSSLFFADSAIKDIPNSVLNLPNLQYLNFDNNRIENIPEPINLPALYSINLAGNLLKTLPESLIQQPKINAIKLDKNPLEFLPKAYNDFQGLELSIDDKRRLLDYEYKGAGNKGTVLWNDTRFYLSEKDNLFTDLSDIITKNKLTEHQNALLALTKKAIGFSHTIEEDYNQVGNHRFGGNPDLPSYIPYPTFIDNYEGERTLKYEFIGQINCELIADLQDYLPKKGMLFFFFETIHHLYGGQKTPCKVLYVENNEHLESGKRFDFQATDYYEMFELYSAFKVDATPQLSVPTFYSIQTNSYLLNAKTASLQGLDNFHDVLSEKFEEPIREKFKYDYAINAYGFTQHESPELQASLQLKGNPEDWIILLKVTSSGDMQWGDAGDLFFVMHKSDLAKSDFSNVFVTMESS
jgi:uncharacterized protein YwqG